MDESQFGGESGETSANRVKRTRGAAAVRAFVRAVREWPGWFTAAAGAVLCVLGWYGVSGESLAARQLPYLASATVPGAALIVAGAVLVAARADRPQGRGGPGDLTDRRVQQLYTLLVEQPDAEAAERPPSGGGADLLAVADGTLYHRPGCPLVTGKDHVVPVGEAELRERGLTPCPVCDPPGPAPADGTG